MGISHSVLTIPHNIKTLQESGCGTPGFFFFFKPEIKATEHPNGDGVEPARTTAGFCEPERVFATFGNGFHGQRRKRAECPTYGFSGDSVAGWLFVSVLGGPERPLVASPWPGNCPLVPRPRGRQTAFPALGARWGPGCAEMDELLGGPAPRHGGRSHRKKGSTFRRPRFTSPRPEVTPQSLNSWPGVGEGRGGALAASPLGTPRLCVLGAVPFTSPAPRWPRDAGLPQARSAVSISSCTQGFHAGRTQGKHGRSGLRYGHDTDSRRKRGAFLPQLERHPWWGFC